MYLCLHIALPILFGQWIIIILCCAVVLWYWPRSRRRRRRLHIIYGYCFTSQTNTLRDAKNTHSSMSDNEETFTREEEASNWWWRLSDWVTGVQLNVTSHSFVHACLCCWLTWLGFMIDEVFVVNVSPPGQQGNYFTLFNLFKPPSFVGAFKWLWIPTWL